MSGEHPCAGNEKQLTYILDEIKETRQEVKDAREEDQRRHDRVMKILLGNGEKGVIGRVQSMEEWREDMKNSPPGHPSVKHPQQPKTLWGVPWYGWLMAMLVLSTWGPPVWAGIAEVVKLWKG